MANDSNLPGEITEVIGVSSINSVGETPAQLANLALGNLIQNTNQSQQNSVSNQQTTNSLQATVVGKVVNMLTALGPLESKSAEQLLTGNAVAEEIADLKASVSAFTGNPPMVPLRPGGGGGGGGGNGRSPSRPITGGNLYVRPERAVKIFVQETSTGQGTVEVIDQTGKPR
jgi:hypothetical protein